MKGDEKMKFNKLAAIVLTAVMLPVFSQPVAAAESTETGFADVKNHWAEKAIEAWQGYGIINGDSEGNTFRPNAAITRAEMASVLNRLIKYQETNNAEFFDVSKNAWYASDLDKLNTAGVMLGSDGKMRPRDMITRQEAAVMICRAFDIDLADTVNGVFRDEEKIADWALPYVGALYNHEVLKGRGDSFEPLETLTRAEVATMLSRLVSDIADKPGVHSKDVDGNLIVNTSDVELDDMTVTGNLIITEGVGNGDVSIKNVTVKGDIILRGCGENSFHILPGCDIGTIIITKTTKGTIRVVNEKGERIPLVYVNDGVSGVILEGNMNNVVVNSGVKVTLRNANLKTLSVAADAQIKVENGSSVNQLDITAAGTNAKITNEGSISKTTTVGSGSGNSGGSSSSGGGSSKPPEKTTQIDKIAIQLMAPAFGNIPDTADVMGIGYSAATVWQNADGTAASYRWKADAGEKDTFTANQAYRAIITVTAASGYEFSDDAVINISDGMEVPETYVPTSVTGDKSKKVITMTYDATEDKEPFGNIYINGDMLAVSGEQFAINANIRNDNHLVNPASYSYQWYSVDASGKNAELISGATEKRYNATAPNSETTLYFVCKVTAMGKEYSSAVYQIEVKDSMTKDKVGTPNITTLDVDWSEFNNGVVSINYTAENLIKHASVDYKIELCVYGLVDGGEDYLLYGQTYNSRYDISEDGKYMDNVHYIVEMSGWNLIDDGRIKETTIDRVTLKITPIYNSELLIDKEGTKEIVFDENPYKIYSIGEGAADFGNLPEEAIVNRPTDFKVVVDTTNRNAFVETFVNGDRVENGLGCRVGALMFINYNSPEEPDAYKTCVVNGSINDNLCGVFYIEDYYDISDITDAERIFAELSISIVMDRNIYCYRIHGENIVIDSNQG